MFDLGSMWLLIVLAVITLGVLARLIIKGKDGKLDDKDKKDIVAEIRAGVFLLIDNTAILTIQKEGGRPAVRTYILKKVSKFIETTETLTDTEKAILDTAIKNNSAIILDELEKELEHLGILKKEETEKE